MIAGRSLPGVRSRSTRERERACPRFRLTAECFPEHRSTQRSPLTVRRRTPSLLNASAWAYENLSAPLIAKEGCPLLIDYDDDYDGGDDELVFSLFLLVSLLLLLNVLLFCYFECFT